MKRLLPVIFCLLLFSCTSIEERKASIPSDVLPEEKMALVMVDVHLLEAALNAGTYGKDNVMLQNVRPSTDILKKNEVTREQFDKSFDFYSRNPKLLAEVYQLVLNDLSKMQAQVMTGK
ncbi:MAG: DUF4296 domain-containing protein [Bacteroidia bacterium]